MLPFLVLNLFASDCYASFSLILGRPGLSTKRMIMFESFLGFIGRIGNDMEWAFGDGDRYLVSIFCDWQFWDLCRCLLFLFFFSCHAYPSTASFQVHLVWAGISPCVWSRGRTKVLRHVSHLSAVAHAL